MNRPRVVRDSDETERRLKDGHGLAGGRETGQPSLLFRPWYVWGEKVHGRAVEYDVQ
jgi:hypothetical protein